MSAEEIMKVVEENGFNVTFSGGDPLYQIDEIIPLATEIRRRGYNVWCYTGFTLEEIMGKRANSRAFTPISSEMLSLIDVLVDGPYIEDKKDISLVFRGSSNQRIIDVKKSFKNKQLELYLDD